MNGEPTSGDAEVSIEPMTVDHLDDVLRIDALVYPRPWSASLWRHELSQQFRRCYLVALEGSSVVGYAGMMLLVDEAHVASVAVDPRYQGAGVASRLVAELLARGVEAGYDDFTLEVRMSNERAQALYRRFGFVPAGVRRNYYSDSNEDAMIMWMHDAGSAEMQARWAAQVPTARRPRSGEPA